MTPLRPEIVTYLENKAALGMPGPGDAPVDLLRANSMPDPHQVGPAEEVYSVENIFIAGETSYIPVRIYRPSNQKNLPALIYFHGGGWVLSTVDNYDSSLRSLANKTGCVIIAPTYQKAPEHRFPIPFNDCYATLDWAMSNAEELGIDVTRIGVGGDSAGGNLAAAVALCARDSEAPALAFQLLIVPCTDYQFNTESGDTYAEGYGLTKRGMEYFVTEYVDAGDRHHPYAFPMHATNHSDLAPAIVITCEYDVLRDDGATYVERLAQDGTQVNYIHYDDAHHGTFNCAGITDLTTQMHLDIAGAIKQLLEL